MVRRVFSVVYREVRGLHQAAYVLAGFALGSQLLALVRDRMLASQFGAGAELDMYYAAFRIPDLLYVVFASTLSVYVLIPFVASSREQGGDGAARKLLSQVFSVFLIIYAVVAGAIVFGAPYLVPLFFPGIADSETLVILMRILLLQPLLLGVSSLFGVVTQLGHRFVLYAVSPLLYNLGIIAGIALFYPVIGLAGLAWGVVLGALGHLLVQVPLVRGSELAIGFSRHLSWTQLRDVLALSLPRAITLSLGQFVLLVLAGFASMMAVGSVSVFQFAQNLHSVPLSIIGVSYSVAAFPMLAELYAAHNLERFRIHVMTAIRHVIFWAVPATGLIIVLRAQIVRVVLGSGSFDWEDTRLTAAVLAILSLALLPLSLSLLLTRTFYAGGRTRIPFYTALLGAFLAVFGSYASYLFILANPSVGAAVASLMRLGDVSGSEVLSLAFGYTAAVTMQVIVLTVTALRTFGLSGKDIMIEFMRSFVAAWVAGGSAYIALNFFVVGINDETFLGIFIQGSLSGMVGIAGGALAYAGLRSPELHEIYTSFQKRLLKTDVVAPQEEIL